MSCIFLETPSRTFQRKLKIDAMECFKIAWLKQWHTEPKSENEIHISLCLLLKHD